MDRITRAKERRGAEGGREGGGRERERKELKEGMAACTHFEKFTEISQTPRRTPYLLVFLLALLFFYFLTATREMVPESIIHGGGAKWRGVDVDCSDGNRHDCELDEGKGRGRDFGESNRWKDRKI